VTSNDKSYRKLRKYRFFELLLVNLPVTNRDNQCQTMTWF